MLKKRVFAATKFPRVVRASRREESLVPIQG